MGGSSSISCLYVGTSTSKLNSEPSPTTTTTCLGRWRTRIWNLWDIGLQGWQSTPCLQTTIPCPLDRLWGHWQRNSWILTTELGHASGLIMDFHKAYLAKPGPLSNLSWSWPFLILTLSNSVSLIFKTIVLFYLLFHGHVNFGLGLCCILWLFGLGFWYLSSQGRWLGLTIHRSMQASTHVSLAFDD